jgi:hypothetical protein
MVLWDMTPRCFRVANASKYVLPPSSRQKIKHSAVNLVLIQRDTRIGGCCRVQTRGGGAK